MRICLSCGDVFPSVETICNSCDATEDTLLDWDDANTELRSKVGAVPGAESGDEHTPTEQLHLDSEADRRRVRSDSQPEPDYRRSQRH